MRIRPLHAAALLALGVVSPPAGGQTLVFDINTHGPEPESSFPAGFTEVGALSYFRATTEVGSEPWLTDGTAAGTRLVADIVGGPSASSPGGFTPLPSGDVVFAATGPEGRELWRTDGTAAGTSLVKDIRPGLASSSPSAFTALLGAVYFFADDGTHGRELWRTDGTTAGTRLVAQSQAGAAGVDDDAELVVSGGRLFFGAPFGSLGHVLWSSDGSLPGTTPVATVTAQPNHPITELTDLDGTLLFVAHDQALGPEVWRSDGTPGGTSVLLDIATPGGSHPQHLVRVGDRVLFSAHHPVVGRELFRTDGTPAGTTIVQDIEPSLSQIFNSSDPKPLAVVGDRLFFSALTKQHGRELWVSDGSTAGTYLVADVWPGSLSSQPASGALAGSKLVFTANDGSGVRLFSTAGAPGDLVQLDDGPFMNPQTGSLGTFALYSSAAAGTGHELWITDGTTSGTGFVKDLHVGPQTVGSSPFDLTAAGDRLFFRADDGQHGAEVWVHDANGTRMVKDIAPGEETSFSAGFTPLGDRVFLFARDPATGLEPWITDGTAAGTSLLLDVFPGPVDSNWSMPPGGRVPGPRLLHRLQRAVPDRHLRHRRDVRRHRSVHRSRRRRPRGDRRRVVHRVVRPIARSRALRVRRHRGGDRPAQGHLPRPGRRADEHQAVRRRGPPVLPRRRRRERPRAVDERRHAGRHVHGQGPEPGGRLDLVREGGVPRRHVRVRVRRRSRQ